MEQLLKIGLAIMFFICLLPMPYGYYELVRFCAMLGFAILAYSAYKKEQQQSVILFICLAILFQPLVKIALGRQLWNLVDVVVAVALIASVFWSKKKNPQ